MRQKNIAKAKTIRSKALFWAFAVLVPSVLPSATAPSASIPGIPDKVEVDAGFSTNRTRRAFRDYPVKLDLSGKYGFAADVTVGSLPQFSGFDIQFRSGGGWYDLHFEPEKEGEPERVVFLLGDAKTEGKPRGWDSIDLVRFSGWREGTNDTFFSLANFSFVDKKAVRAIESAKERKPQPCPMPDNGEFCAFWCHSAYGLGSGHDWDSSIDFLTRYGYNAIIVNFAWPGVAYYRSSVLPEYPRIGLEGDQLEKCLAACRKYGVACHVWKVCYNIGTRENSKAFAERMSGEGRTQVRIDGKDGSGWLCPSDSRNIRYEIDAMVELSGKEGLAGIHFDYIRYPTDKGCYCDGCRERFELSAGRKVAKWPEDLKKDSALALLWKNWRVANITAVVRGVAERVRPANPGMKISAAVFSNPAKSPDMVAQDWLDWCRKGYLDFVCPMNYLNSGVRQRAAVLEQLRATAGLPVKVYPGVGLSVFRKDGCDARRLSGQIAEIRACGAPGFTVFNFDRRALDALPLIPRR